MVLSLCFFLFVLTQKETKKSRQTRSLCALSGRALGSKIVPTVVQLAVNMYNRNTNTEFTLQKSSTELLPQSGCDSYPSGQAGIAVSFFGSFLPAG